MPRHHISMQTKLAAALLALGDIPYEDAKGMTADQIVSLYHFDHGILHAIEPIDEPWNLTPRLIHPHREKSRRDTSVVAKTRVVEAKWREFTAKMAAPDKKDGFVPKRSRKIPSRPFRRRKP